METIKNSGYKHLIFEENDKFLVTGAAGFVGSNLVEAILKLGYAVRGIDNFLTGKEENIEEFLHNEKFEFIEGDICKIETCRAVCNGID